MSDHSMEQLKTFLIRRLILVAAMTAAAETVILIPVQRLIIPAAVRLAGLEAAAAGTGLSGPVAVRDLPGILIAVLGGLAAAITGSIPGTGQSTLLGIAGRSGAFLLLLTAVLALLLPLAAGIIYYAQAVTARVSELQRLRDAEHKAMEAQRNLLLSDMAHDLKTPITTISGYSRALHDGLVKDENTRSEYLEAIERKSSGMAEQIDLLFEYAKLGSADFRLERKDCDINALAAECAAALYTDIEEAGMELDADIPERPFIAAADRTHLARIFNNLLLNAVRHNPAGTSIILKVTRLAGVEYIAVADSGPAIEKDPESLFAPFVKGDDSRSSEGSGLGLSIARKVADMHGFSLTLLQPCTGRPECPGCENYTKAFVLKVTESSRG